MNGRSCAKSGNKWSIVHEIRVETIRRIVSTSSGKRKIDRMDCSNGIILDRPFVP